MIRYLLNRRPVVVERLDPNTLLLPYLRQHLARSGTKEGCASGDCGACSVVLAEPDPSSDEPRLRYRAVNSCITPLSALHGRQLISVEDLAQGQVLHPVQQAMVDEHGSQCGFCTPGFIMALFAYDKAPDRDRGAADELGARQALAGNLCRCTGYRPILAAAQRLRERPRDPDQFEQTESATLAELLRIRADDRAVALADGERRLFAPRTLAQLIALSRRYPQARLCAGATDLALDITQQMREYPSLIDVSGVAELCAIRTRPAAHGLSIGAALPLSDVAPRLSALHPGCRELLERFGSPQIRNRASLGGNLASASPIGDIAPLLIALGARIVVAGAAQQHANPHSEACASQADGLQQRSVLAEQFFIDYRRSTLRPGEVIVSVELPSPAPAWTLYAYKISKRYDDDISTLSAAIYIRCDKAKPQRVLGVRAAFGGMAATPRRAEALERALLSRGLADREAIAEALSDDFKPLSDARASAAYRLRAAANLLERLRLERCEPATAVRAVLHA